MSRGDGAASSSSSSGGSGSGGGGGGGGGSARRERKHSTKHSHRKKSRSKKKKKKKDKHHPTKHRKDRDRGEGGPSRAAEDALPSPKRQRSSAPADFPSEMLPSVHVPEPEPEPAELAPEVPRRTLGAQRPEEAAAAHAASQVAHRVWDPSLGAYRMVRLSGEIVEECVSRGEQQDIMREKASHVPRQLGPARPSAASDTFTGRSMFPSQHPWHGYK